jgi:hypothetical protein
MSYSLATLVARFSCRRRRQVDAVAQACFAAIVPARIRASGPFPMRTVI